MGLVNFGLPEEEASFFKNALNLNVFVEGGTFRGGTAKAMSEKFNKIFTIEKSDEMYAIAQENLKDISNVTMLKGDTREHLKSLLENNDNILFWLDAHWSGGITYGSEDECPLIEELKQIFSFKKNYIILIDDARLFLAPPSLPHDYTKWPGLKEIIQVIPEDWDLIEYEDVFYVYPKSLCDQFKKYLQKKITAKLADQKPPTFLYRVLRKLGQV